MVKLNKIYTKTGDRGDTALGNGERVLKDSLRVSAYGNVDELNASIGVINLYASSDLKTKLINIQNDLFDLGADLCVPISVKNNQRLRVSSNQIETIESEIDEIVSNMGCRVEDLDSCRSRTRQLMDLDNPGSNFKWLSDNDNYLNSRIIIKVGITPLNTLMDLYLKEKGEINITFFL